MDNANGDDWREELYLKIRSLRELCLPHLSDLYQINVDKLHQQESLLPPQRSYQFEKLKQFKTTLERMIQFLSVPKSRIMPGLKHKMVSYEKKIMDLLMMHQPRKLPQSQTLHGMQQNASSSKPGSSLEPGQGSGLNNGNELDWQEQVFQKIQAMKVMYLPELSEIYQRVASKVPQHESVPQQQRSDEFAKLIQLKTMLERMMQFLSVAKGDIMPALKDKLGFYEKQIIGLLNLRRPRETVQQQLLWQSLMQQPQSHDSQTNPQMQSMSIQVSGPRAQESSLPYMQNNVLSSLHGVSAPQQNIPIFKPASILESGQGNALNNGQQVFAMGSMQQITSQQVNNGSASASAQSVLWTLHSNVNQTQLCPILLQHQHHHLRQQHDQLMQLKRQYQYRQMQQQQLLQLLQQQQQGMPQQITQQLKQQFQYRQMQQQQLQQQMIQLQQQLQARQQEQQMRQQLEQQFQQQQNMSRSVPASNTNESGQGNALNNTNGGDLQEEVFQKINSMKERYLADLNELYQIVEDTVQQDALPPQQRSGYFEKQKQFKTSLKDTIRFLNVPKRYMVPEFKDVVDYVETQIKRYLNAYRRVAQGN